jgi:hypothetical protein
MTDDERCGACAYFHPLFRCDLHKPEVADGWCGEWKERVEK